MPCLPRASETLPVSVAGMPIGHSVCRALFLRAMGSPSGWRLWQQLLKALGVGGCCCSRELNLLNELRITPNRNSKPETLQSTTEEPRD